jgi:hypothetical protein
MCIEIDDSNNNSTVRQESGQLDNVNDEDKGEGIIELRQANNKLIFQFVHFPLPEKNSYAEQLYIRSYLMECFILELEIAKIQLRTTVMSDIQDQTISACCR